MGISATVTANICIWQLITVIFGKQGMEGTTEAGVVAETSYKGPRHSNVMCQCLTKGPYLSNAEAVMSAATTRSKLFPCFLEVLFQSFPVVSWCTKLNVGFEKV